MCQKVYTVAYFMVFRFRLNSVIVVFHVKKSTSLVDQTFENESTLRSCVNCFSAGYCKNHPNHISRR